MLILAGITTLSYVVELEAGMAQETTTSELMEIEAPEADIAAELGTFESLPQTGASVSIAQKTPLAEVHVMAMDVAEATIGAQIADIPRSVFGQQYDDGGVQVVADEAYRFRTMGSVEQAVDGVVTEIHGRLRQGNLLVLWLFDASNSLKEDRTQASQYLKPLLADLEKVAGPYEVQHSAVAYGSQHRQVASLTADSERLIRAARNVPSDPSGQETLRDALGHSVSYYRQKWDSRIMVVVWTDEAGDDLEHLESAIELCKKERVAVTVVGAAASFGRRKGQQGYPTNVFTYYLPVDKGPESGVPDRVGLPSIRHDGPLPLYHLRSDVVSSGFGPYGLVRLARETGGSYFVYDRFYRNFDTKTLAPYVPDYRAVAEIEADVARHPLRAAVVQASRATASLAETRLPKTEFYRTETFPFGVILYSDFRTRLSGDLRQELGHARAIAATIEQGLQSLNKEGLEAEHSRERSVRWQAAYDLARGELLAASVQYREYTLLVEQLLARGLQGPGTNRLLMTRGGPLRSGEWGAQRIKEANRHFARCQADHAGTPWAAQSATIDPDQAGYTWQEQSLTATRRAGGGGGGGGSAAAGRGESGNE